jgi:hypothetical protein
VAALATPNRQRRWLRKVLLPQHPWKPVIKNGTAQAMAATGNVLRMLTYAGVN